MVIRYASDLESGDEAYTDANGREMLRRVRDQRPTWDLNVTEPTAGNYYPVSPWPAARLEPGSGPTPTLFNQESGRTLRHTLFQRSSLPSWYSIPDCLNLRTAVGMYVLSRLIAPVADDLLKRGWRCTGRPPQSPQFLCARQVTAAMYISDQNRTLTVHTDRAQGTTHCALSTF